MRYVM